MISHERKVSFKEWRPSDGHPQQGVETLRYGILRPLKAHSPHGAFARIQAELSRGRIVSTFLDMTMRVLGPHHDSPDVHSFDEDMKHYHRQLV